MLDQKSSQEKGNEVQRNRKASAKHTISKWKKGENLNSSILSSVRSMSCFFGFFFYNIVES